MEILSIFPLYAIHHKPCPLGWSEQKKIGRLKSNTNQRLPNGRYSKNCENFFKNIIVFCPLPRAKG